MPGPGDGIRGTDGFIRRDGITQEFVGETASPTAVPRASHQVDLQTEVSPRILQRYDVRLCLYGKNGAIYSEWEALTNFLLQLQALDKMIQVLPWQTQTHQYLNPPIDILSIPQAFFDLQTYAPRLASTTANWTTRAELGRTRHPYLFLSPSVPPAQLVARMGPWLCETKQGLWLCQLPLAKHTICIGWLL